MARIRLRLFLADSSRAPLLRKGAAALRFAGLLPAYAFVYSFARLFAYAYAYAYAQACACACAYAYSCTDCKIRFLPTFWIRFRKVAFFLSSVAFYVYRFYSCNNKDRY